MQPLPPASFFTSRKVDSENRCQGENATSTYGILPGHIRQATTSNKTSCEDPDVRCWDLEELARNIVDIDIELVDTSADHSSYD